MNMENCYLPVRKCFMIINLKFLVINFLCVLNVIAQDELYKQITCIQYDDCASCLWKTEFCSWCDNYQFIHEKNIPCNTNESLLEKGCPKENILNSANLKFNVDTNLPLSDISSMDPGSSINIHPQKVTLDLRPGTSQNFSFEYRLAKNYPLDLYYLMDITSSMSDDKDTLAGLKDDLIVALQNLTEHFRMGFGTFADKPLMPYIAIDEKHLKNPCSALKSECEPTYTFKHRLNITDRIEDFVSVVNETLVTANLDNTEAVLEALMQTVVCASRVGWIEDSRKIVIVATDGLIHFAGTGKLGGAVNRNDKQCHLDENGFYTKWAKMDYPSLAEISQVLSEHKVNVIFAVTEDVLFHYNEIHKLLPDTTYVGVLDVNSSNILNLVRQGYEDFVSSISFRDDADESIKLTYFSDCGTNGSLLETSKCEDVVTGHIYNFTVNISLDRCPKSDHGKVKRVSISEAQTGGRALIVEVVLICNCDCSNNLINQVMCPENSDIQCGECICREGWLGPKCDCSETKQEAGGADIEKLCMPDIGGKLCSGNGDCICGTCFCDLGFAGTHCECVECPKENGLDCGGSEHGICSCGTCICKSGWKGDTCTCPLGESRCTKPGESVPCSGYGNCTCGECKCFETPKPYKGKFCEVCADCEDEVCEAYEDCARALVNGESLIEPCRSKGTIYNATLVNIYTDLPDNVSHCVFREEENELTCEYRFTYEVQRDWTVEIKVYPKNCFGSLRSTAGIGIFVGTLIIGLVGVIIWKIRQVISDTRAYKTFCVEKEMQMNLMGKNEENPLYKSPISKFQMPAGYNKSKTDITEID